MYRFCTKKKNHTYTFLFLSYCPLLFMYHSCPSSHLSKPAHLILSQSAAGPARCRRGLPTITLHPRPHLQIMHALPEHSAKKGNHRDRNSESKKCKKISIHNVKNFCTDLKTINRPSPIFPKQGDCGTPYRSGASWPINIPHSQSHLSILWQVRILHWQPQPLVPATNKQHMFSDVGGL